MKGQVVGVVTVKVTNGQNINLAIGAARVKQLRPGQLRSIAALLAKERLNDSAATLRPDNAAAHYNLAVAYFETGNDRLALSEAKILRQLDGKLYEKLVSETRLEQ